MSGPRKTYHVTIAQIRRRHRAEEKRLILGALERNGGNVDQTARDLKVKHPSSLRAIIRAHGIELHKRPVGRPRKEQ
jgi:transposase-like protein